MAEQPEFRQEYLQEEEADEILAFLQRQFPDEDITKTRESLFYSAVARPFQKACYSDAEPTLQEHAADQMLAFAENHSLNNANKRMGLYAAYMVLKKNGYTFKKERLLKKHIAPLLEKVIKYKDVKLMGIHYSRLLLTLTIRLLMVQERKLYIVEPPSKVTRTGKSRKANKKKRKRESKKGR